MIKNLRDNLEQELLKESSQRKRFGMAIVAIFLGVLIFMAAGCTGGGGTNSVDNVAPPATAPVADKSGSAEVAPDDDVMVSPGQVDGKKGSSKDEKSLNEDVDVISNDSEKMVAMVVESSGRPDPFLPAHEAKVDKKEEAKFDIQKAKLQYDLVDPPNAAQADDEASRVLTTKVSGVMYDAQSPSAILNIEGADYLVRSGDVVNGYKVLAITPSVVTVQLGANVYKAGVGQLLATDGIQYNTISNLNKKFGGAKK